MPGRIKVFLDTSALFAGVWSHTGGGRAVLKLAELGAIQVWVSPQVLEELDRALRHKAPDALPWLALLLDRIDLQLAHTASAGALQHSRLLIEHAGDAMILATAVSAEVDYFVTLDRQHFLANAALREAVPFPIGTPGDFLQWFRDQV